MLKIVTGFVLSVLALQIVETRWIISIVFLLLAVPFQHAFARLVNTYIRGNAPEMTEFQRNKLRSTKDVRGIVPIWVGALSYMSISFAWAAAIPLILLLFEKFQSNG